MLVQLLWHPPPSISEAAAAASCPGVTPPIDLRRYRCKKIK